nr:hypothetical protein [Angustibacter aerolatus]
MLSRRGWQVWATHRLLDDARTWLYPVYASLLTPTWLRVLGARVGRGVEASTVLLLPRTTTVGDHAFLADDTLVGEYQARARLAAGAPGRRRRARLPRQLRHDGGWPAGAGRRAGRGAVEDAGRGRAGHLVAGVAAGAAAARAGRAR